MEDGLPGRLPRRPQDRRPSILTFTFCIFTFAFPLLHPCPGLAIRAIRLLAIRLLPIQLSASKDRQRIAAFFQRPASHPDAIGRVQISPDLVGSHATGQQVVIQPQCA